MKVIGLTGGIASGKSTVSKYLADLGAKIIDADKIAKEVVQPGKTAYTKIVSLFGKKILIADGSIDRQKLAALVFSEPDALKNLNEIIHPEVIQETKSILANISNENCKVAVVDAPLLIEVGMTNLVDEVWLVVISPEEQVRRAVKRDKATQAEIQVRIAAQMPLEDKKDYAKRIIDNSGSLNDTFAQVDGYFKELISE